MKQSAAVSKPFFKLEKLTPYIFVSPFYISFLVFGAFPILFSLFISFHSWNGIREMTFNGFANYYFLFKDPLFWKSVGNTVGMLLIGAIPSNILALIFAYILNRGQFRFKNFFKGVLFLPYITSSVAVALVFGIFYGTQYGLLNYLLKPAFALLESSTLDSSYPVEWLRGYLTLFSISFLSIWRWTGWNTLIYLAAMQGISPTIYEAARIDGATSRQILFKITIPMLKPVIFFAFTMSIIGGMQAFDESVVLLGIDGGPENSYIGFTTSMYIYNNAFRWGYFGIASAASYVLFGIILILAAINKKLFKEDN